MLFLARQVQRGKAVIMAEWVQSVRERFPALRRVVNEQPLIYLDSAATALKPDAVVQAMSQAYAAQAGSVHRSIHGLAGESTALYEAARVRVAKWLGAEPDEVVFTRGTTEGLNLGAQAWARPQLRSGDQVLVTALEHHANWLPWQQVCQQTGAELVVVPLDKDGAFSMSAFEASLSNRTTIVAVAHASNVMGTLLPIADITERAHAQGAKVVVDGAQVVAHMPVNVRALGCDFYSFSGHKLYGPNGIGVLWGRRACLGRMPPWQTGGGMVMEVRAEETTFAPAPQRFEAGTPAIAPALGLVAAMDFVESLSWPAIQAHAAALQHYTNEVLSQVPGLTVVGPETRDLGIFGIHVPGVHPHDLGTALDVEGIAVRAGHLCAQPLMGHLGVSGLTRISLGVYNKKSEIDVLCTALDGAIRFFGP